MTTHRLHKIVFQVACDGCGALASPPQDFIAWAEGIALAQKYQSMDGAHLCLLCQQKRAETEKALAERKDP